MCKVWETKADDPAHAGGALRCPVGPRLDFLAPHAKNLCLLASDIARPGVGLSFACVTWQPLPQLQAGLSIECASDPARPPCKNSAAIIIGRNVSWDLIIRQRVNDQASSRSRLLQAQTSIILAFERDDA